jgi:hypothetical protein
MRLHTDPRAIGSRFNDMARNERAHASDVRRAPTEVKALFERIGFGDRVTGQSDAAEGI